MVWHILIFRSLHGQTYERLSQDRVHGRLIRWILKQESTCISLHLMEKKHTAKCYWNIYVWLEKLPEHMIRLEKASSRRAQGEARRGKAKQAKAYMYTYPVTLKKNLKLYQKYNILWPVAFYRQSLWIFFLFFSRSYIVHYPVTMIQCLCLCIG